MIDLHCHPLPGLDDGPDDLEEALAFLKSAAAAGIRKLVATPHVSTQYPTNRSEHIAAGVREMQEHADAAGIDVEILAGAEMEMMHLETLRADELLGLRLGDGPFTLVELPFTATAHFAELLLGMHREVQPALLAHPERCRAFHEDIDLLERLVRQGVLAQVTASSFTGEYGSTVEQAAWTMLERGLVHVVASDGHGADRRRPAMREPMEEAGLGSLVTQLCEENPAAILAGQRPAPAQHSRRLASRRRLRDRLRRRN